MDSSLVRAIAERSESQLGLITRTQLEQIGVDRHAVRRCVRGGRLVPLSREVLRTAGAPLSHRAVPLALALDVGGIVSHRTAAALHGIEGFGTRWLTAPEASIRHGTRRPTSQLGLVHRSTNLSPDDVTSVGPIPCTSIARTLFGLAGLAPVVPTDRVRAAVDTAVRDGLATDAWLWWRLESLRCRGRNGVSLMEAILADRAGRGRTESWLERQFLDVVGAAGIPLPLPQRRIAPRGAFVARVDFLYPVEMLVVEVNGHGSHSTKAQRDADSHRLNELLLEGYRTLTFTYDDVVQRPADVCRTVAAALRRAA